MNWIAQDRDAWDAGFAAGRRTNGHHLSVSIAPRKNPSPGIPASSRAKRNDLARRPLKCFLCRRRQKTIRRCSTRGKCSRSWNAESGRPDADHGKTGQSPAKVPQGISGQGASGADPKTPSEEIAVLGALGIEANTAIFSAVNAVARASSRFDHVRAGESSKAGRGARKSKIQCGKESYGEGSAKEKDSRNEALAVRALLII